MKIKSFTLLGLVPFFVIVAGCGEIEDKQLFVTGSGIEPLVETRDVLKFPAAGNEVPANKVDGLDRERVFKLQKFTAYYSDDRGAKASVERDLHEVGKVQTQDKLALRANWPSDVVSKPLDVDVQLNLPLQVLIDAKGAVSFQTRYYNWTRLSSNNTWQWRSFGESEAGFLLHDVFNLANNVHDLSKSKDPEKNMTAIFLKKDLKTHSLSDKASGIEAKATTTLTNDTLSFHYEIKQPQNKNLIVRLDFKLIETRPATNTIVAGKGLEVFDDARDTVTFPLAGFETKASKIDDINRERTFALQDFVAYYIDEAKGTKVNFARNLHVPGVLSNDDKIAMRAHWPMTAPDEIINVDLPLNLPMEAVVLAAGNVTFRNRFFHTARLSSNDTWSRTSYGGDTGILLFAIFDPANNVRDLSRGENPTLNATPIYQMNNLPVNSVASRPSGIEAKATTTLSSVLSFHYEIKLAPQKKVWVRLDYKQVP